METSRITQVVNEQGLHARPCHSVVSRALGFRSELRLRVGSREVNGKSIIELMTLGAARGDRVEIRAWGPDAQALVGEIEQLFVEGFGEHPDS